MRRKILFILAAALFAAPAWADPANDWTGCSTSTSWLSTTSDAVVSADGDVCYEFDETLLNATTADTSFRIAGNRAWFCMVSNVNADGLGSMRLSLYKCGTGFTTASAAVCEDLVASFTTDTCEALTKGRYFIDVTADVTATEDAVLRVQGYE